MDIHSFPACHPPHTLDPDSKAMLAHDYGFAALGRRPRERRSSYLILGHNLLLAGGQPSGWYATLQATEARRDNRSRKSNTKSSRITVAIDEAGTQGDDGETHEIEEGRETYTAEEEEEAHIPSDMQEPGTQNEEESAATDPRICSELEAAYRLITSPHSLRGKTTKSTACLREECQEDMALLSPMYIAAERTLRAEAEARGQNPANIKFGLKPHQMDGIGMMRWFEQGPYKGCLLGD